MIPFHCQHLIPLLLSCETLEMISVQTMSENIAIMCACSGLGHIGKKLAFITEASRKRWIVTYVPATGSLVSILGYCFYKHTLQYLLFEHSTALPIFSMQSSCLILSDAHSPGLSMTRLAFSPTEPGVHRTITLHATRMMARRAVTANQSLLPRMTHSLSNSYYEVPRK